ncbi:MAG: LUD domain-containing protein, partial [Halobacteria archaeon]|nr:LUD domain-containing protein [Halobacteria archaeon]
MIDSFERNAGATVHTTTREKLAEAVASILEDSGAEKVVVSHSHDGTIDTDGIREASNAEIVDASSSSEIGVGERSEAIQDADVGITEAGFGIADLGVVCVELTPGNEGIVSLAPEKHVAVIAADSIYDDSDAVFELMTRFMRKGRDDWIFISGPSSTADLGAMVQGIHGPAELD